MCQKLRLFVERRQSYCNNKKLSYCCDSRSYCMQYFNEHNIMSTTSRPLNKNSVCCQSANPINNYCGSAAANSQSAHLCARAVGTRHRPRRSHRTALCRLAVLETLYLCVGTQVCSACTSFVVVHFVAKRYILQQKCQKGQIGTWMLGARWNNF